jgi:hypothetical protein
MMMITTSFSRHGRNILVFRDHRVMIRQTSLFQTDALPDHGMVWDAERIFWPSVPGEYLSDKTWAERREVGLYALRKFKALKQ